jgi:hypothetical protein
MVDQDHDGRRRQEAEAAAESSVPLLEKKPGDVPYYVEGCPGCAVDRRKATDPGIPYGSFIYIWVVILCTGEYSIIGHHHRASPNLHSSSSRLIDGFLAENPIHQCLVACLIRFTTLHARSTALHICMFSTKQL